MTQRLAKASLTAKLEERFSLPLRRRMEFARKTWFSVTLAAVFLLHAILLSVLLWRDRSHPPEAAKAEETPIEVVVEPPKPEPKQEQKPQQKPVQQQKQAEEKPATSAPRAQNDSKDDTAKDKETKAPKATVPPDPAAAPPQTEQAKEEPTEQKQPVDKPDTTPAEAAKPPEPDKDAEALDKEAPPEPPRKPASLRAKPVERPRPKAATQLAGTSELPDYTFAKPMRKKFKFAGGTEDDRYLSEVFGMITQNHRTLEAPVGVDWMVAVAFQVDSSGNLVGIQVQHSSGFATVDAAAIAAVESAAPFPPPPSGATTGLIARLRSEPHDAMAEPR